MRRSLTCIAVCISVIGWLAGCGSAGRDPYDESQMDMKPVAARVTEDRHTGKLVPATAETFTDATKSLQITVRRGAANAF